MDNDSKIKQLLNVVEIQRTQLGTKKKSSYSTNGIFKFDEHTHLNLNVASEDGIVNALAFLIAKRSEREEACKLLGIENNEFFWQTFTFNEWLEDFKTRIEAIKYLEKKKKLDATEKQLNSLISEEARTENELDAIAKLLDV